MLKLSTIAEVSYPQQKQLRQAFFAKQLMMRSLVLPINNRTKKAYNLSGVVYAEFIPAAMALKASIAQHKPL